MRRARFKNFALGLTAALLLAPSMVWAADPGPLPEQVEVRAPGNTNNFATVKFSELSSATYTYSINGSNEKLEGYTLRSILQNAESQSPTALSLKKLTSVNIDKPREGGYVAPLEASNIDSNPPPMFYAEDGNIVYVDALASRKVVYSRANPAIQLVNSSEYVTIAANPNPSKVGEAVNFSAQAVGMSQGEKVTYAWSFGDGTTLNTTKIGAVHSFKKKGTFTASVTATGNKGFRASKNLSISVAPKKSNKNRKGGGKKKEGGETGTADPPPSTPSTGGYGDGGYGGSGYPGGTGLPSGTPPAADSPAPKKDKPAEPVDDGLVEVTGELVSSSTPAPTEVIAQTPGGAPEALQEGTEKAAGGIADWVLVVLGLGVLLGFGALVEKRGSRLT